MTLRRHSNFSLNADVLIFINFCYWVCKYTQFLANISQFLANIRRVRTSLPYSSQQQQPATPPPLSCPPHGGLHGEGRGQTHLCS